MFLENPKLMCSGNVSVRSVMDTLRNAPGPVGITEDGRLRGVIHDCEALVKEHSYASSPFPIAHLLNNAVCAYLLATQSEGDLRTLVSRPERIALRDSSQAVIAWVEPSAALLEWVLNKKDEFAAAA